MGGAASGRMSGRGVGEGSREVLEMDDRGKKGGSGIGMGGRTGGRTGVEESSRKVSNVKAYEKMNEGEGVRRDMIS